MEVWNRSRNGSVKSSHLLNFGTLSGMINSTSVPRGHRSALLLHCYTAHLSMRWWAPWRKSPPLPERMCKGCSVYENQSGLAVGTVLACKEHFKSCNSHPLIKLCCGCPTGCRPTSLVLQSVWDTPTNRQCLISLKRMLFHSWPQQHPRFIMCTSDSTRYQSHDINPSRPLACSWRWRLVQTTWVACCSWGQLDSSLRFQDLTLSHGRHGRHGPWMRWTAWSLPKIHLSICCFEISDEVHTRSSVHCLASCLYARISVGESSTMNPTENLTIKTIAIHDVTGDLWLWLVVDLCVFLAQS